MLGIIGFKNYRVPCIIGTKVYEREAEQNLFIDLKVEIDFSKVAATGDLHDTIDYVSLTKVCHDMAIQGKYLLIEKYAHDVAEELLKTFSLVSVWIRVKKPAAIPDAECALVEFKLERQVK